MSKFALSQIPVNPTFRDSSINTVVVVPLLSQSNSSKAPTRSTQSFHELFSSLRRHQYTSEPTAEGDLVLVVPNSALTRPGEWRYSETPLKSFHWQHGCQRSLWHDGRPEHSRRAHDKLFGNSSSRRNWIDLYPHRRTAAIVGVLNMHDCKDAEDLQLAIEELHQWAARYSMPPYQATAHGSSFDRDTPVERLFVYDSFDDENQNLDLSQRKLGTSILAFPPSDEAHEQMMDLHMNVVISDLTVAIFRDLEAKIQESAEIYPSNKDTTNSMRSAISRYISGNSTGESPSMEEEPVSASSKNLGIGQLAGLVSPESKLAKDSPKHNPASRSSSNVSSGPSSNDAIPTGAANPTKTEIPESMTMRRRHASSKLPQLITPMDEDVGPTSTSTRDSDVLFRREHARREKYMADLSLLAGSPLDAYERYLKAAESCKTSLDPLWHAMALEGCAAAHIAMAEAGGFSVDDYLENNFQMPEDIMAKAREDLAKPRQHAKQTLPEIVLELCEEALNIVNRSPTLVYLHTEMLLKLASYCSEESEAHLRCRWGEGAYCYAGEPNDVPRWERTSVSKLSFNPLSSENMGDMITYNSYIRAKKVCNLISRAVSMEGIDPATRVDVAIRGAQVCTNGIKATHWPGRKSERLKLHRKAAFFTIIAAEAAAVEGNRDIESMTSSLWQLATRLYSHKGNEGFVESSYGWAALRAFCLSCVSHRNNSREALAAAEELLTLLSSLQPSDDTNPQQYPSTEIENKIPTEQKLSKGSTNATSKDSSATRPSINLEEVDLQHAVASASQFAKSLRSGYAGITSSSPLYAQSKWAHDNPVGAVNIPLSDESVLASSLVSLPCAWGSSAKFRACSVAQQHCVDRLVALQRAISTSSCRTTSAETGYPLYLVSCEPVETEAEDLECVLKRVREEGAMATFYNPFEAKKSTSKKKSVRVPKDEERAISVVFGNRFSLPLDVQRAQVRFKNGQKAVKAATLSFTVPPNTSDFTVHFPFTIITLDQNDEEEIKRADLFEVTGLSLTCLGKSLFLPLKNMTAEDFKKPAYGTEYALKNTTKEKDEEERDAAEVEVFPCQPNLHVYSSDTGSPVQTVTVPLSDGEIFTVPAFLLTNDLGPSMKASIECLEIFVDGPSATKLFDSVERNQSNVVDEDDFIRSQLYELSPPPLKIRVVSNNLALDVLNGKNQSNRQCSFEVQLAAAHNLGQQIVTDTNRTIVFRYRGPCSSDTEVWRKKTISLKIVHAKGPRLSSLALRPDFTKGCRFSELSATSENEKKIALKDDTAAKANSNCRDMLRLGVDDVTSVCGAECTAILTVANETRSTLTISHPMKLPLGFPTHEAAEMIVHPGVSAKIPLQLKRISRSGNPCDEIVSLTTLVWKMHKGNESGTIKARGRLRVPAPCLQDIIMRQPSSLLHLYASPCTIDLSVGGMSAKPDIVLNVSLGQPVDVASVVTLDEWIPHELMQDCGLAIEFRCVKENTEPGQDRRNHVWAGLKRSISDVSRQNKNYEHRMKLAFCSKGAFIVSCCAKLYQKSGTAVEVWWSEHSMNVMVADFPTQ